MAEPIWQWSAIRLARTIASGELSAREALGAILTRADAVNPKINAIVEDCREEAFAAALDADERQARGESIGPLHGVPLTTKSNVAQRGCATSNGVVAFAATVATEDSAVIANLRRSGAILFGRTNVPPFSWRWFTDNDLYGLTVNPHDPSVTCGGSSGGAAAAVAVGIGPLAHGSDLAGSIRHPAACCGVFGLKPSMGLVPNFDPGAPDRPMLSQLMVTQGPIARSIDDLMLGIDGMRGRDIRDPWQVPSTATSEIRTGRIAMFLPPPGGADLAVEAALGAAAEQLRRQGYLVETIDMPGGGELRDIYLALLAEAQNGLMQRIDQFGDAKVKRAAGFMAQMVGTFDLARYAAALSTRSTLVRRWRHLLSQYEALLAPVSWRAPFKLDRDQENRDAFEEIAMSLLPTIAANILGLPALAFPGLSTSSPVGLQLIGPSFQEAAIAQIARLCSSSVDCIEFEEK